MKILKYFDNKASYVSSRCAFKGKCDFNLSTGFKEELTLIFSFKYTNLQIRK